MSKTMCTNFDCRAYKRMFDNKCSALSDIDFRDKDGNPIECPFYKTDEQWTDEILKLRASGHVVDARDVY